MNSESLRITLSTLESALEAAGTDLLAKEAAHKIAVTRAVLTNRHDEPDATEAAVTIARVRFNSVTERCDEARRLLALAIREEREARAAISRASIRVRLEQMAQLAGDADADLAAYVSKVRQIFEIETALHRQANVELSAKPWRAPQVLVALRSAASALSQTANGNQPNLERFVANAVADGTKNIEGALS